MASLLFYFIFYFYVFYFWFCWVLVAGLSLVTMHRLLTVVASLVSEHRLQGTWAQ